MMQTTSDYYPAAAQTLCWLACCIVMLCSRHVCKAAWPVCRQRMRRVCSLTLWGTAQSPQRGACDERPSVQMVTLYCYTVMFEAKLLMELMGLGSYAVRGEKGHRQGWLSKAHLEVAALE